MFTDLADLLHSNLCQKCGNNRRCFDALLYYSSCTLCNAIVENPTALSVERHYCFHPLATTRLNIPLIYTTSLHLIIEQYTCAATPQESTGKKKTVKSLHEQTKHLQTLFSNTVLYLCVLLFIWWSVLFIQFNGSSWTPHMISVLPCCLLRKAEADRQQLENMFAPW